MIKKKSNTVSDAQENAKYYLKEFIKKKDYSDLINALNLDNTNPLIIFEYLNYLKKNDKISFNKEVKRYKFYLDDKSCSKLGIPYIDHKKDLFALIDSIQKVDTNDTFELQCVKEALKKYYPKEDKKIMEAKNKKRVNNLPLNNLNDDIFFYLSIKVEFGRHLYFLINYNVEEDFEAKYLHKGISYIKIYSYIIQRYLEKDERDVVFSLIQILDLFDYFTKYAEPFERLYYLITQAQIDFKIVENNAKELYKKIIDNKHLKKVGDNKFNDLYFQMIEGIMKSNCIKQLVNELNIHNKDTTNLISIDEYYIKYIKNNLLFFPFFNGNNYGLTITLNGKILINNVYKEVDCISNEEKNLYNFCIWIITGLHEIIGHFLKDYYYYMTNFQISEESPKKLGTSPNVIGKEEEEEEEEEEEDSDDREEQGQLVEELLFKSISNIYLTDILYILNLNNWEKSLIEFSQYFVSDNRKNIISSEEFYSKNNFDSNKQILDILSLFGISQNDLKESKTNVSIRCKRVKSQPFIDMSNKKCVVHMNRKKMIKKYQ